MEIKSDNIVRTLMPLEHNLDIVKKPVIVNKIQYDSVNNIISECEFYKKKIALLEMQSLNNRMAYHILIKDINDIIKDMNSSPLIISSKQFLYDSNGFQ